MTQNQEKRLNSLLKKLARRHKEINRIRAEKLNLVPCKIKQDYFSDRKKYDYRLPESCYDKLYPHLQFNADVHILNESLKATREYTKWYSNLCTSCRYELQLNRKLVKAKRTKACIKGAITKLALEIDKEYS